VAQKCESKLFKSIYCLNCTFSTDVYRVHLCEARCESVQYGEGVRAVSILSALFYLDYLAFTVQVSFYSRDLGVDTGSEWSACASLQMS
jgi:hypothetical protein